MKSEYRSAVFLLIIFVVSCIYLTKAHATTKAPIICNQTYALCSAAKCIPDPSVTGNAICSCETKKDLSVGNKSCKARKPHTDNNITYIVSTFSFKNKSDPVMSCPANTFWTNCMDAPCTIDPMDPSKSICSCPIVQSKQAIVTFGGGCDTSTCENSFWSGAIPADNTQFQATLAKQANINIDSTIQSCSKEQS